MAQPQQQQQYPHNQQHHAGGGRGGGGRGRGRYNHTGMYGGHQQHHVTPQLIGAPRQPQQQVVFQQGVPFFIPGQQNLVQYGGLPQQQQPQYPMAYQNVLMRPHNQLYQPTNTFQPTATAFIPSTDQSQNQGLFRQPQKPAQQPAAQQQTQQQPLKREKKALLIINPDTNKPINVNSPATTKAPSKSPEPEPLVPLVSPTTDAKREFQQKIGEALTKPSSVSSQAVSLDDRGVQLSQVLPGAPTQPLQISNVNLQQPTHTPLLPNLSDKTKGDPTLEKKVEVESENKEPGKETEMKIVDVPKPVEEPEVIQHPPELTREPPHSPPPEVKPVEEVPLEEKELVEVVTESKEPDSSPTSLPTETPTILPSTDAPATSLPPDDTPQSHSTGLHADAAPITSPTDQTEVPSDVVPVEDVLEHQVPSETITEDVEKEKIVEESKLTREEPEGVVSQLLESEGTSPPEPQHEDQSEELQVESEPSVELDEEEVEEEALDTEEKEEGEISDGSTDDSQDEPISKKSCPLQSNHPPQRDSSGRLKYDREYLLSFRFLKECKEPPKELMHTDSTLLELIRRSKYDEPVRRDAFLPIFSQAGVKRQSKERERRNRGNQGPHPRVIEIEVEKVELSKSENAWKRTTEVTVKLSEEEKETSELYRKFQGILNKLTPQKFQKLAEQAKELAEKMDTQERMSGCIEKIFIKALEEPVFSVAYAKLCLVLTPYKVQVTGEDGQLKMKSFRALLLTKCQQEFEKDKKEDEDLEKLKAAIEAAKSEEDKKARKDEYDAAEFKSRHRSLGNIRFIGELFKFKLLSEAIIHECIQRLLKSTSDGESLECFAKLMTTIGKELDHDKGQNLMDRYFGRVDHIIEANKIGSRVKFMLQDVVDLRKNTWVPRKIVASNVPTTIDKLHADHHQQAEEMKRMLSVQPNRPRQPPGDSRRRDDYSSDSRRGVQQLHAPEKLETDRLRRLGNRPQGETATKRLGPSTWSTKQAQQPQSRSEPQKVESTKYGGRSSKGKKTAGPAPSGSRRSATQLIATEAKKQQKDVIAAVALQTGYKVQPTPVVSDALSEEDVEKKSESLYVELCSNLDYKEALLCVSEMRSPGKLHRLVFTVLNVSMEKTSKCRHTAGVLFDRLVKEGHLSSESLLKGLNELLELSEDLECDLPKFWDYIAEVLAPPVVGGGLPLADLKQTHDHVLQSGKMGKLVAKTLQKCTTLEKISQDHVSRIWSESGLDWTSDLRVEPSDVKYLVEDHSLQFLSHSSPPAIQVHSGVSHDKQQEWIHRLQLKLSSSEDTNDDVVSFIEKHHSEHCHSPPFIYSLSCALVNAGVSGSGDSVVYKSDLLERRCPVLKHFVDHHSNLQIDIIYGLQVTLSKKQHPKGILDQLFTLLYEHDVIGEDAFILWEEEGREDLEGRGVALMSAKPFMEWLRSVDNQDGQ